MFDLRRFVQMRTRRARRAGALLLLLVWAMTGVSQVYAACCGPHGGTQHQSLIPAMEMHANLPPAHEGCPDPQEPCCPQMSDAKLGIAGAQTGIVDDGRLAQPVLPQAAPLLFEPHRPRKDRIPDTPDPPGRVYLRLQRLLI